jgi:hypothetical protein
MEDKKTKDTVLEVQDGTIDLSALFERIDKKLPKNKERNHGKAGG